jgi:hypothetical protein
MTRRYAVLAALAVGALVTPTVDIVSQLAVAVPLYLFYEAGVPKPHPPSRGVASLGGIKPPGHPGGPTNGGMVLGKVEARPSIAAGPPLNLSGASCQGMVST